MINIYDHDYPMLTQPVENFVVVVAVAVELFTDLYSAFHCVMSHSLHEPHFVPFTHYK